jgi:hypothetical protein
MARRRASSCGVRFREARASRGFLCSLGSTKALHWARWVAMRTAYDCIPAPSESEAVELPRTSTAEQVLLRMLAMPILRRLAASTS